MADSKRRILLIALGTTPHLLTFTLAALYKESPEAMPTEIRIVTTELGAEMARGPSSEKAISSTPSGATTA